MKCTFQNADFTRALADLFKVVPSHPTIPVLGGILATVEGSRLHLSACDLEMTLSTAIDIAPEAEAGSCVISADKLKALVEKLPAGSTSLEVKESSVTLKWNTGRSTLPVFDAADFPSPKAMEDDVKTCTFVASRLLGAISSTLPAVAEDDSRPAISGVYFDINASGSQLVGTDSRKLIISGVDSGSPDALSFVLHRKACSALKAILAREDDATAVSLVCDGRRATFSTSAYTLITPLITAKFPNYRSIIPAGGEGTLTVHRKELIDMISRISVCADRSSSLVKMLLSSGCLSAEAQDLAYNAFAQDSMLADYIGDDLTIGFNAKNLLEVIGNLTCNVVRLHFNGSKRAVLFTPSEEEGSVQEKAILMPLALAA